MELDENLFNAVNAKKSFENFGEKPIVPEMVKPVSTYEEDLAKMGENRRESSFSLPSDISVETTGSEASLPHLRYFRTPSVVVSDHSEDTGCVTYDDIRRIHSAYHRRRRRGRVSRRHSDVVGDSNEQFEFGKRTESSVSGSTDTAECYKDSRNTSPVPRRKNRGYCSGRKSLSLDQVLGDFDPGGGYDRKDFSECNSSNELSPILSRCGSSNCSGESSRRSSILSEISPVFLMKNYNFGELQRGASDDCEGKSQTTEKISPIFSHFFHPSLDDMDFSVLERQRSVSYDDLYTDSPLHSDMSFSDISTDFSACSSLSNLPGTVYYSNYNPGQRYNANRSYKLSLQNSQNSDSSRNGNIKTSKSCSDFLSVSRITEDYPHLKHRRHSNGQVNCDISEYRSTTPEAKGKSSGKLLRELENENLFTRVNRSIYPGDTFGVQNKNGWTKLVLLKLKSFHESLYFNKKASSVFKSRSRSSDSLFSRNKTSEEELALSGRISEVMGNIFPKENKPNKSTKWKENRSECVSKESEKVVTVKKEWLSVEWRNGSLDGGDLDFEPGTDMRRKGSDCSTCSFLSVDQDASDRLTVVNTKVKVSLMVFSILMISV